MRKLPTLFFILFYFVKVFSSTDVPTPKEELLRKIEKMYEYTLLCSDNNRMYTLKLVGKKWGKPQYICLYSGFFLSYVDSLILLEKKLSNYSFEKGYCGFIDKTRAKKIVLSTSKYRQLYQHLLKYQYDTVATTNYSLYLIHYYIRYFHHSEYGRHHYRNKDTVNINDFTNRILDFSVLPRPFSFMAEYENEYLCCYNEETIDKLIRIAKKQYNEEEISTAKKYYIKSEGFEENIILPKLLALYSQELYRIEPNEKKRNKKIKKNQHNIKQYYSQQYKQMYDSLATIYAAKGIDELYKKDVSPIIEILGKINTEESLHVLNLIINDTIKYSHKEISTAQTTIKNTVK